MSDSKYTVHIPGSRGTKMVKSTGPDNSSLTVKGNNADLRNSGFRGGKDDLSHSIKGAKVGDPD